MLAKAKTARPAKKAAARPATASVKKAPPKAAARPAAKAPVKAPLKAVSKPAPKSAPAAKARTAAAAPAQAMPAVALAPRPAPAPRPPVSASPREVAAAHEYLLNRSANRSEEPIVFNGRRLPTEEQLLKMPDSAYMNEDQLAFFKYRLQRMEQELLANAGETTEHLRETVIVPDPADRATIEEEHALELRTRDRERKLLKKVQSALQRIDGGDYGYCEETGDPIGIPRLLARPTATLSLEAQQRRELKQKLFGD
jgi:DnaK suppressor protein